MLQKALISINNTLDGLIKITTQDIEDIKQANHEQLFKRNEKKEKLLQNFITHKSSIDSILTQRSQENENIAELLSKEEDELLGMFREKLQTFYKLHKHFASMAFGVANFYNILMDRVSNTKSDVGYEASHSSYNNISIRG